MKIQQTQQSEISTGQTKRGNGRKCLLLAGLGFGIATIAITVIWVGLSACATSSRPSTPEEIAEQKQFQEKLNTALTEYQEKVDAATKEAGQIQDSGLSAADIQKEFQVKLNTTEKVLRRK